MTGSEFELTFVFNSNLSLLIYFLPELLWTKLFPAVVLNKFFLLLVFLLIVTLLWLSIFCSTLNLILLNCSVESLTLLPFSICKLLIKWVPSFNFSVTCWFKGNSCLSRVFFYLSDHFFMSIWLAKLDLNLDIWSAS